MEPNAIHLRAAGYVELKAEADGSKPKTFEIDGYTGVTMNVEGSFYPVVLELSGMKTRGAEVVVLRDHNPAKVIGQGRATINATGLHVSGIVTADNEDSREIISQAKNGFKWQASIGASVDRREFLDAGKKAKVNGREVVGPMVIARQSTVVEVSFVAIGADGNTSARVAASFFQGLESMDPITTTATRTEAEIIATERTRIAAIDSLCKDNWGDRSAHVETLKARAINGELTTEQLQSELLVTLRAMRGTGPAIHTTYAGHGGGMSKDTLSAAFLIQMGDESTAAKKFGDQVTSHGRMLAQRSFVDLNRMHLEASGRLTSSMGINEQFMLGMSSQVQASSSSTYSLPTALSDAVNLSSMRWYYEAPATYKSYAKINAAADFKPHSSIRMSMGGQLEKVGNGGEVKHNTLSESVYTWSVDTYAKQIGVTRKDLVNDGAAVFADLGPSLGRQASRAVADLVYTTIMANAGSFFHTANNGNLIASGGSSALDATSLALAIRMMRQQRDANHNDLDIMPIVLVVPPELEQTGKGLLNSEYIQKLATDEGPTGNTLKAALTLVVESRLSNTAKFANASTTGWYLFASPADAPVIVGFLDGIQVPQISYFGFDQNPNALVANFRCVFDFGAALGDPAAAVKSPGA